MAKQALVQYRHLKREDFPVAADLKALIVESMRSQRSGRLVGSYVGNRRFDLDQDGRITLLNRITEQAHWGEPFFAGQLTYFEKGANVPAIIGDPDDDVNELNLGQFALDPSASMVHGILYFVVIEDHVGIIESTGLRGRSLERFLTQLLTQTDQLPVGHTVTLNTLTVGTKGRKVTEAREVQVAAKRSQRSEAETGLIPSQVIEQDVQRERREGQSVIRVLEALDWTPEDIERLMEEVPPGGWLEGFFRFFIKSRKARRQTIKRETLDEAFRNVDPKDVTFLSDGKRESGGLVKLTSPRAVETVHSLLHPTSAIQQIEAALRDWASSGQIDLALP